jgi:N6-L-threonylcarbamoyladenine synthase
VIILGIETSCDETAVSVIQSDNGVLKVLANVVSSQVKLHAKWGGVVPNLAAREHLKNMIPVLQEALEKANATPEKIDLLCVTQGPGLIPALLIGNSAAKTLSFVWQKPLLGIHHIEGHIYANFIGVNSQLVTHNSQPKKIKFPILCLVVSGGHTQLVLMKKHLSYEIIGQTLDDAAGEAFDKVARILGLGYPGGPAIAQKAMEISNLKSQISNKFKIQNLKSKFPKKLGIHNSEFVIRLPRPMMNKKNFDFSFSGLKTAVLYATKKYPEFLKNEKYIAEMAHEFQQSVVDVLVSKTLKAAEKFKPKTIMLAGGVSANQELRRQLGEAVKKKFNTTKYILPDTKYSIDNASMIAAAGFFRWQKLTAKQKKLAINNWKTIEAAANLKLK